MAIEGEEEIFIFGGVEHQNGGDVLAGEVSSAHERFEADNGPSFQADDWLQNAVEALGADQLAYTKRSAQASRHWQTHSPD